MTSAWVVLIVRRWLALGAVAVWGLTVSAAHGQTSIAATLGALATQEDVKARTEEIQKTIEQIEGSTTLDAETKTKVLDRYKSALRTLGEVAAADAAGRQFVIDAEQAAERAAEDQRAVATLLRQSPPTETDDRPLSELDADRAAREAKLATLRQKLMSIETDRRLRPERLAEINTLLADPGPRLAELRREAEAPGPEGEHADLAHARRIDAGLKLTSFERSLSVLQYEKLKYQAEEAVNLLRGREELARAEIAREEMAVRRLAELAEARRAQEAAAKIEYAEQQKEITNPLLKPLAEQNRLDAEENGWISARIAEADRSTVAMKRNLEDLNARFGDIRQKERDIGLTRPIGLMLRQERGGFPDLRKIDEDLENRQDLMDQVRLASWKCDETIAALPDARKYVQDRLEEAGVKQGALTHEDRIELERAAGDLLRNRWEGLSEARDLNDKYFQALYELDAADRRYVQRSREYLHYINERILWTRSADPLTIDAVRADGESRAWLVSLANWKGMLAAFATDPVKNPFAFWPTLIAIAALSYVRVRIRPRLRALGGEAAKRGFLRYGPTAQAAVLTLMSAVAAPAALLFLSWRLAEAVDPNGFSRSVATALEVCAAVLFPVELLREACRHMGLAEAHFMWPGRAVGHLRRALTWMKTLGLPVTFLAVLSHQRSPLSGGMPTDRILFIAGMVLAALTVHRLLSGRSELSLAFLVEQPKSLFSRYRPLWYGVAVIVPIVFAGLSVAGYHYSATQVAYRLLWTLWLAAGAVLIRAMAVRGIVLSRRRLLLDQIHQKRAAEDPQDGAPSKPVVVEETDVAKTTAQTRKFLDIVMLGLAATGLAMIWADTLPAIKHLDRPLWSTEVAETPSAAGTGADDASPAAATTTEPATTAVRTFDVPIALMIAIFTFLASRNLPGLIEMSVLNRLPVDNATRYAATRLASYAIIIVGLLMASNRLGLRWQNVQWLAAALTVGLGFGLQEVFANFVSGLIVLFERPVRVGDVVTIDGVTGSVSKIRMRATTITNWDRKEFIVPNKEFITGRVLNWTLSDAVNRVTINVGIAYGADPDRARDILVRICDEHPLVLKDPRPVATFESFGESTLNIVLRCFLPNLEPRSDVTHELHTRIDREFRKAGIEMAFPQRDLHLRTVNGFMLPVPATSNGPARSIVDRAAG